MNLWRWFGCWCVAGGNDCGDNGDDDDGDDDSGNDDSGDDDDVADVLLYMYLAKQIDKSVFMHVFFRILEMDWHWCWRFGIFHILSSWILLLFKVSRRCKNVKFSALSDFCCLLMFSAFYTGHILILIHL